jgi:HEPN domain-containing protein
MPDALFAIPRRIRRAVLTMLSEAGAGPDCVISELGRVRGFTTLGELIDFVTETYGQDARAQLGGRLMGFLSDVRAPGAPSVDTSRSAQLASLAQAALVSVPDSLFVLALDVGWRYASDRHQRTAERRSSFERGITELFVANGVPYHFEDGSLVPSISPTASAASIQPAVDVLNDPRLAQAQGHFGEALRRLEEPDTDEAVDEARQATEAAMLAVLNATGIAIPDRRQPDELFNALAPNDPNDRRAMSRDAMELVLAAARFRGRTSAGHSGGPAVTLDEARAVVASAAAALLYLASTLP